MFSLYMLIKSGIHKDMGHLDITLLNMTRIAGLRNPSGRHLQSFDIRWVGMGTILKNCIGQLPLSSAPREGSPKI